MTAKARILAAADGTLSVRELAALAGCHEQHARRVVRDAGLPVRPASVKAKVIALADGRRTAPQIARLIGARPTWVREIANDLCLPVPLAKGAHGDSLDGLLRWAARPDRTIRSLETRLGVPYATIQRRLARLGLPFKQCRRGRPRKETAHG